MEILNINLKLLIIIIINCPEEAENADNTPYIKQGGNILLFLSPKYRSLKSPYKFLH